MKIVSLIRSEGVGMFVIVTIMLTFVMFLKLAESKYVSQ